MLEKPLNPPVSVNLVERDRLKDGALEVVAYSDTADPAGELAELHVTLGSTTERFTGPRAQALALNLLALTNGNWLELTDAEREVRHGQLRLELERAHG